MFEQNCPGEGAFDHDSIELQQPHKYIWLHTIFPVLPHALEPYGLGEFIFLKFDVVVEHQ